MTRRFTALGWSVLVAMLCSAVPVHAQSTATASKYTPPFKYDVSSEITLSGSVSTVVKKAEPGMIAGAHLLVETHSGTVDASLGRFALLGKDPLTVAPGEQVQLTGIMRDLGSKQVFVTRLVKVGSQVYTIRTERGMALTPQARERLGQQAAEKGVQP